MNRQAVSMWIAGAALGGVLAVVAPAAAQTRETTIRAGIGLGSMPRGTGAGVVGTTGHFGVYANRGARADAPLDGQLELAADVRGQKPSQQALRLAALIRLRGRAEENFDRDPSPRFHFVVGPQLDVRGVNGNLLDAKPDLRIAIGADVTRRRSVIELRYTADIGVGTTTVPARIYGSGSNRTYVPPTTRPEATFVNGTLMLTVAMRFGG